MNAICTIGLLLLMAYSLLEIVCFSMLIGEKMSKSGKWGVYRTIGLHILLTTGAVYVIWRMWH